MKLLLLALVSTLSLSALAHIHPDAQSAPKMRFAASELGFADSVATQYLDVRAGKIKGFESYQSELAKMKEAFSLIETVINSNEFKEKVINYVGKDGKRSYIRSNGLTNEQVYEAIMAGKELIGGEQTPGEMNFDVTRYMKFWSKVIGYTEPGKSNTMYVHGKFYKKFSPAEISGNITHEWLHLCGFYHGSAADHDSVPYAVGYIMRDLTKKLQKQGFLD